MPRLVLEVIHRGGKIGELVAGWSETLQEMPPLTVLFNELEFSQAEEIGARRPDLPVGPVMDFLLDLLDRTIAVESVLVVGATSHPDTLRRAFVQPGRLERIVECAPIFPDDIVATLRIHAEAAEKRAGHALFEAVDWSAVVDDYRAPAPGDWVHILHATLRRKARCEAAGERRRAGHHGRPARRGRALQAGRQPARRFRSPAPTSRAAMETWVVTGGAGFIGSNFVRRALTAREARMVVVDKLTYAGNLESLADVADDPRFEFVRADIADRGAIEELFRAHRPTALVNFAAETHVDRSIDGPAAFVHTNLVGTFELLEAARQLLRRPRARRSRSASASCTSRPTRSTARSAPTGAFVETHSLRAELALLRLEGRRRSPGARLRRDLRPADADHQLLEQLRALPVPGEADPADDPERARRHGRCRSTATAATCATGFTSRITARASSPRWSAGVPARSTTSAAAPSAPTSRWWTRSARELERLVPAARNPALAGRGRRQLRGAQDLRRGPSGPRPALRDRRKQGARRARLEAGARSAERPGRHRRLVSRAPRVVRGGAVRSLRPRATRSLRGVRAPGHAVTDSLGRVAAELEKKYGEAGAGAAARLRIWLSGALPFAHEEVIARHLDVSRVPLCFDAFWQELPFGTGGRRGRVGYGANRMNETTVAMTVQGHCDFLRRQSGAAASLEVVVANDVRVFRDLAGTYRFLGDTHPLLGVSSRSLARLACEIYAGNGIRAWFADPENDAAVLATPQLSYLIDALGAAGGINLSASHNPPDDNGVKTYDSFGSQPVAPEDQQLIDVMAKATDVRRVPFGDALARGLVRAVEPERQRAYVDLHVKLYAGLPAPRAEFPITYTPLCGCGLDTVGRVLETLGFPVLVPDDQRPDGSFASIPFRAPNPEVPQATAPTCAFADAHGSEIVLSSDPDADRVGVEARLADGSWFHFDGNQIAALLGYFLMLDPEGPRRRGLVIETLVTTKILGRIAAEAGDSPLIDDLLVGFKYVADVLKRLGRGETVRGVRCSPDRLVLAAEESHGVIMIPSIRDKDAAPACMLLAALHQRLRARGQTLLDYYIAILERLGGYDNVEPLARDAGRRGHPEEGPHHAVAATGSRRAASAASPCTRVLDFWDEAEFGPFVSASDRLPRDVLQLQTDAFVATIRPSGTEPKLKLYLQLLPGSGPPAERGPALLSAVRQRASEVARQIYADLLARIDLRLDAAALLLPDIIDLDRKLEFQERTLPALRAALEDGKFASLDALLDWLRGEVAAMAPGSDALPALKEPIAYLCETWAEALPDAPLRRALAAWARS